MAKSKSKSKSRAVNAKTWLREGGSAKLLTPGLFVPCEVVDEDEGTALVDGQERSFSPWELYIEGAPSKDWVPPFAGKLKKSQWVRLRSFAFSDAFLVDHVSGPLVVGEHSGARRAFLASSVVPPSAVEEEFGKGMAAKESGDLAKAARHFEKSFRASLELIDEALPFNEAFTAWLSAEANAPLARREAIIEAAKGTYLADQYAAELGYALRQAGRGKEALAFCDAFVRFARAIGAGPGEGYQQRACCLASVRRLDDAMHDLRAAQVHGFDVSTCASDDELEPLWKRKDFAALLKGKSLDFAKKNPALPAGVPVTLDEAITFFKRTAPPENTSWNEPAGFEIPTFTLTEDGLERGHESLDETPFESPHAELAPLARHFAGRVVVDGHAVLDPRAGMPTDASALWKKAFGARPGERQVVLGEHDGVVFIIDLDRHTAEGHPVAAIDVSAKKVSWRHPSLAHFITWLAFAGLGQVPAVEDFFFSKRVTLTAGALPTKGAKSTARWWEPDEDAADAVSTVGGAPLLPAKFTWPTDRRGKPMLFAFQVELNDGHFVFFIDERNEEGPLEEASADGNDWRAFLFPKKTKLEALQPEKRFARTGLVECDGEDLVPALGLRTGPAPVWLNVAPAIPPCACGSPRRFLVQTGALPGKGPPALTGFGGCSYVFFGCSNACAPERVWATQTR